MASPTYFPEGNTPNPQDTINRKLQKINGALFDLYGDQGPSFFPEGSSPLPQDDVERSFEKIEALLASGGSSTGGLVWGPTPETVDSVNGAINIFITNLTSRFPTSAFTQLSFGHPTIVTNDADFSSSTTMTSLEMRLLSSIGGLLDISNGSAVESLSFPGLLTVGGVLAFGTNPLLTTASFPLLTTVGGDLTGESNDVLIALTLTSLVTVGGIFNLSSDLAIETISLPALTTVSGNFTANTCTALTSFSAPLWLPTDGTTINFNGDALDAASVNHILARCVAAGVTTCTIDLSGGTNAAPTGQGITDAADLATAGNTVTTN